MAERNLDALLDINQIAEAVELPPDAARTLLNVRGAAPVATYRGRPLWFSDAVHEVFEERRA